MKNIYFKIMMMAVVGLLAVTPATLMANDPAARFRGGSNDGWDMKTQIQSVTDWSTFPTLIAARNWGGSYDGYAMGLTLQIGLPPIGTLIQIR